MTPPSFSTKFINRRTDLRRHHLQTYSALSGFESPDPADPRPGAARSRRESMPEESRQPAETEQITRRRLLRKILMLDDTAHSIALGTAIGMFIGMTPTVGIQMILVLCLAVVTRPLFHFSKIAALLTVYISNPFTVLPIYWFNYSIGTYFVEATVTYEDFARTLEYEGFAQWWDTVVSLFVRVGAPLFLGSLAVATVTSLPTYPLILWFVRKVREEGDESSEPETEIPQPSSEAGATPEVSATSTGSTESIS